ncbi:MAG: hypothetical protein KKH72_09890 [Alphaproteobacteria bacterium]|nr:hypothetical protein [Alphaproteobacteria bacterium]
MTDRFSNRAASLEGPAIHGFAVTPSDATPLAETTRALYVGTAGNVSLTFASGASATFTGLAAGSILPVRAVSVLATGTTASGLVALV